jgi:hypothetical protein
MSPAGGRTAIVYQQGEAFSIIDLLLATELSFGGLPTPDNGKAS